MTVVREDLVSGHRVSFINGGITIVRTFHVSGLITAPEEQLLEAITDPLIPDIGAPYPVPAYALTFVLAKDAAPAGPDAATVSVNYSSINRSSGSTWNQPYPGAGNDGVDVKQVSSGVREVPTFRDATGNLMLLNPPPSKDKAKPYPVSAIWLSPVGSLIFERTETAPGTSRMRSLVGKLNSPAIGAYGDKTLLFRSFEEQSEDGGRTWNCTYTFDFREDWLFQDAWRDQDGKLASDVVPQSWDIIQSASFAGLGLDFSDSQTPL